MRYLYPVRKRIEVLAAVFSIGFGLHVWALAFNSEPLAWAGMHNGEALRFGQTMSLAGLAHALGVRINGYWRWSPVLRFVGMGVHASCFLYLAWAGLGQTAGYTYGWGAAMALAGAWSAGRDMKRAYKGADEWIRN